MTVANQEQLAILKQGVDVWNKWREDNPREHIDLSGADLPRLILQGANFRGANFRRADLSGADFFNADLFRANLSRANLLGARLNEVNLIKAYLRGANFTGSDLSGACLRGSNLSNADLKEADLKGADLIGACLRQADLSNADLKGADLKGADLIGACLRQAGLSGANISKSDLGKANLSKANLSNADLSSTDLRGANLGGADLSGAMLIEASLIETNLTNAKLTNCNIYGISAWDLKLEGAEQSNLVITRPYQPTVTVSNMKVAQFLYLLINNPEIRDVLDTITSKVVLILGRFTDERLAILDALRTELQKQDYIPVLFDFDAPKNRDVEETVSTLAHMARFIIADITDPKAIPQELSSIVKNLQSVPVLPLLHESQEAWGMFSSIKRRPTVLPILKYSSEAELIGKIPSEVIEVAEQKVIELAP